MRLYSQLTSGQILFSALSNWEFFMVKDKKKKKGWKNLLRKLTNTPAWAYTPACVCCARFLGVKMQQFLPFRLIKLTVST